MREGKAPICTSPPSANRPTVGEFHRWFAVTTAPLSRHTRLSESRVSPLPRNPPWGSQRGGAQRVPAGCPAAGNAGQTSSAGGGRPQGDPPPLAHPGPGTQPAPDLSSPGLSLTRGSDLHGGGARGRKTDSRDPHTRPCATTPSGIQPGTTRFQPASNTREESLRSADHGSADHKTVLVTEFR